MSCAACQSHVERAVSSLPGVQKVTVSLLQNLVTVDYDEKQSSLADIQNAIRRAGYIPSLADTEKDFRQPQQQAREESSRIKKRFFFSGIFLVPLMFLAMGPMIKGFPFSLQDDAVLLAFWQFLFVLPILFLNRSFFIRGTKRLLLGTPNMDSLVALGSGAAVFSGVVALIPFCWKSTGAFLQEGFSGFYFESAGMILTLVTLGKWLEARAKEKTSDAISSLVRLIPSEAVVLRDGEEIKIPTDQVIPGDLLSVRAGERVSADGEIVSGACSVDASALTGESLPQDKGVSSEIVAGMVLVNGYAVVQVNRTGKDTTLAQIIRLVEEASGSKAPIARLADSVSGIFVPVVLGVALIAGFSWFLLGYGVAFSLSIAISVLVISCPCALGLATPTAIMVGVGQAAKRGILVKSAAALEQASRVKTLVFDKTGTVTTGQMQVSKVLPAPGVGEDELLTHGASLEYFSQHPFARALTAYAKEKNISFFQVSSFEAIPGMGVQAREGNELLLAGNLAYMRQCKIKVIAGESILEQAARQGCTPIFFSRGGSWLGSIWFSDKIKDSAAAAVKLLKQLKLKVVLLTGDNELTARYVAEQVGIETVIAEVLPQEKEAVIRQFQQNGQTVAMVGDGINDAPALTRAEVGIAIGKGTEVAAEAADIILLPEDLRGISVAFQLSRAVLKNIKQNLFWAFFYNVLGIPLAAGVFFLPFGWKLNPMVASAAMSLSSVCVVANALRLRFFKVSGFQSKKQGEICMKKILFIEGMMCGHCAAHVERALNSLPGVRAKVELGQKCAIVESAEILDEETLKETVRNAGYEVVAIQ